MLTLMDVLYLLFAFVTLYFTLIFLTLWMRNRNCLGIVPPLPARLPSISLIIPAFNEEKAIAKTVAAAKKMRYPRGLKEIIVVDDGSTDATYEIASRIPGIRLLRKENQGKKAFALNHGLRHAKGELVGCIDADSHPEPDALLKSVPFFGDRKVASVTTRIYVRNGNGILGWLQAIEYAMIAWARKLLEYINSIYATPGPLSLYRKSVLVRLGGFDTKNATEDIEIAWRLLYNGYKIMMSPARTWTSAPTSWGSWWRQRIRWNIGGAQTALKYRPAFFRRGTGAMGFFVLPVFTLSYVLALLSLSMFTFMLLKMAVNNISYLAMALQAGVNPLSNLSLQLPEVFVIFAVILFASAVISTKLSVAELKFSRKGVACVLLYMTIYLTLFPFLLVHSFIKYVRGYREW